MQAYAIDYETSGKSYSTLVDAKDIKSAKKKIGKRHGCKTGRSIKIKSVSVIGYF